MKVARLLIVVLLAVVAAIFLRETTGEVMIRVPPWQVQLSFGLAVIISLLCFFLVYGLMRAITLFIGMPGAAVDYKIHRQRERNFCTLNEAVRLLFEGRYGHAQSKAALVYSNAEAHDIAGMAALIAARAAQKLHEPKRLQEWLARAGDSKDHKTVAAACLAIEAEMQIEMQDYHAATQTLENLQKKHGRHINSMRLEMRARRGAQDWEAMLRAVRQLNKRGGLTGPGAEELKLIAHLGQMEQIRDDAKAIEEYMTKIPDNERHLRLFQVGTRYLIQLSADNIARQLLDDMLDRCTEPDKRQQKHDYLAYWRSQLFSLYGEIKGGNLPQRISRAEHWLSIFPDDTALLITLGRLCRRHHEQKKAQEYLERALQLEPTTTETTTIHHELAQLYEAESQPAKANKHYKLLAETLN